MAWPENISTRDVELGRAIEHLARLLAERHPWVLDTWGYSHLTLVLYEDLEDLIEQAKEEAEGDYSRYSR